MNSTSLPTRKRVRDPEAKRLALEAAALQQFSLHGYEHVSIAQIADAAEIAVGTVYRFFKDKPALLRALHRSLESEIISRMDEDWESCDKFSNKIERVCEGLMELTARRREALQVLFLSPGAEADTDLLPGDLTRAQIAKMYQEGMEAGAFKTGCATFQASMVYGIVEGAMLGWLRDQSMASSDAAIALASAMQAGFLR